MLRGPKPLWMATGGLYLLAMASVVWAQRRLPQRVVANPLWRHMYGVIFAVTVVNLAAWTFLNRYMAPWVMGGANLLVPSLQVVPLWFPGTPRDSAT